MHLITKRKFTPADIDPIMEVVFKQFDKDNDGTISKFEFPTVLRKIT